MKSSGRKPRVVGLPTTRPLAPFYTLSLIVALLMAGASAAGLLYPSYVYPTEELLRSFRANDVVNLALGLPILLGSMWLTRRGKLIGLLFWPGALLFVLYNALASVFGTPPSWIFILYLILVPLSVYTLIGLVAGIDGKAVQRRLAGAVPERLAGGVLAGLGILFALRVIGAIGSALVSQAEIPAPELGTMISDFLLCPAWVIGGALLWQRKALGYVSGVGLLFQTSMLFIGLIAFFLLQPLLSDAPLALTDVIVVSIMGLICFVPFGLVVRGVLSRGE